MGLTCTCTIEECRESCPTCDYERTNLDCPAHRWEDREDAVVYLGKETEQS